MDPIVRSLALVLAAGTLMSISPAPHPRYSAELMAFLDPGARVANLCGGKDGNGGMRAALMVSAAVLQAARAAEPATTPLYDGLGKVHLPITTSNPAAERYFDQGLAFAYGFNHAAAIASFREAQ